MTLRRSLVALLIAAGIAAADLRVPAAGQSAVAYDVVMARNVMVSARDGVKLGTDVYRPAKDGLPVDGAFPAILQRTPYNKARDSALADYFVPRGYVVVLQDVRGRYASEGHWRPIADDPNDGADTAAWIIRQPWSDGGIGTVGTSYAGATQHALAIAGAPGLKTMIPVDAMSNTGHYGVRHNGAFELRFLNWVYTMGNATGTPFEGAAALRAASPPEAAPALADFGTRTRDYIFALPLRPGTTPLKFAPDYERWLVEAMQHGDYDDFWKNAGSSVVDHLADYKDVPVYHITGWYDSWGTQVANMNYVELTKAKKSLQRLIIGPWTHGGQTRSFAGDAEFTADAALDFDAWRLRWLDRWLKGTQNGVDKEPPVRLYVMGAGEPRKTAAGRLFVGGRWRDEQEWPLARTQATPYYLHAGGRLSPETPKEGPPTKYLFDPKHPVPTLGGNVSSQGVLMFQGASDQKCRADFWLCTDANPLSARNDVLVFQTPPLDRDTEVTGRLVVKLFAASSATDTDFTAKLVDVYPPSRDYPNGVDLNVGDSIVRARYRNGAGPAALMTPGTPYAFTIEMYPTSLVFRKGHRIRLDISSSNFPRFDVNPNTGEPLNDNRRTQVAENAVFHEPAHASHIILPIIPAGVTTSQPPR
ncbi:MAG: CocE/NonD family hydrolase [Acidobacteria bacterium]|nr:CocE/NonD family hydrolase [Acidobacteriota bacterium]